MALPNTEKVNYINRVYPDPNDKSDYQDYDIGVFTPYDFNFTNGACCEECHKTGIDLIGTSDTREPKFCFKCYADINKDSEFKKGA